MDFTLMIIYRQYGTPASGYALTSQLKTFGTRELANRVAASLLESQNVEVLKLYL